MLKTTSDEKHRKKDLIKLTTPSLGALRARTSTWRRYNGFYKDVILSVYQTGIFERSQLVLKKVKWTYFDEYLWQKLWNHAKKINGRVQTFRFSVFYNGRSMTDRSSLLKTWKTRETKTWITQNFELVWPIQGRTMWKLTSWRFQKCGTFLVLKVLN